VIDAALYLAGRALVNGLRRRLRRLRQPRYMIGFAVGLLYYYAFFIRPRGGGQGSGAPLPGAAAEVVAMLGLVVLIVIGWLFGSSRSPLVYTPAETHFLFTAPLTRRQVIDFKLLRSQLALALSSLLSVLLFSGGHFPATRILRVLGLWLVFASLQMHSAVTALVRQSLEEHGVTAVRRRLGAFVIVAALVGAAALTLRGQLGLVREAFVDDPTTGFDTLAAVLHRGVLGVVTWPFAALVGPAVAPNLATFAARLPAALLVLAVHYVWLIRSSIAFEEVAVESAERTATRIAAWRSGRRPPPIAGPAKPTRRALTRLRETGSPARAIAWKNIQAEWRGSGVRLPVIIVVGLIVIAWVASMGHEAGSGLMVLTVLCLVFGGLAVVFGPYGMRNDLRSDLQLWDLLKTYPLRGADLVLGEVLGPVTVLTAIAWGCLLGAFTLSLAIDVPDFPVADRVAALLAVAIATPAALAVTTTIQNAAVLFFPAWITLGPARATGIEMIGQRLVTMVGSAVVLVVALIPAAVVGAVAVGVAGVTGIAGGWLAVPGAIAVAVTLVFEVILAFAWLGRVFERSDPATEIGGTG
jgi:ABC-2 type transport system permease protein